MADNPFEAFGGRPLDDSQPQAADPFAQFGGQAIDRPQAVAQPESDPFAAFGGRSVEAEKPAGTPVTAAEIDAIAARTGANAEDLREAAPLFGVQMEGTSKLDRQYLVGAAGRSLLLNVPQFLFKKMQDPETKAGLDELQNLGEDRRPWQETGLEIGAGIASGVGIGRAAGSLLGQAPKALRTFETAGAIGSPAVAGAASSSEGNEIRDAAIGGGIGLATLGLFRGGAAAYRKLYGEGAEETADKVVQEFGRDIERTVQEVRAADEIGDDFMKETLVTGVDIDPAAYRTARDLDGGLAKSKALADEEVREFAKMLRSPKASNPEAAPPKLSEAKEIIAEFRAAEGPEELVRRYDEYRTALRAQQVLSKQVDSVIAERAGFRPLDWLRKKMTDGKYVARDMDRRLGTGMERILDDLGQQNNLYTQDLVEAITGLRRIESAMAATKLDPEVLYEALDKGMPDLLTPEQRPVYDFFRERFSTQGDKAISLGIPIQKIENYVPKKMVPLAESILRVEDKLVEATQELGENPLRKQWTPEAFANAMKQSTKFREYVRGVESIQSTDIGPENLLVEARLASNPKTAGAKANLSPSASRERLNRIPQYLLDRDPRRLLINWSQDTFKAARMRQGLSELRSVRNLATAAGQVDDADYVGKLISDISGRRGGTLAAWTEAQRTAWQVSMERAAKAAATPLAKDAYTFLAETPGFLAGLFNQVYPNLLGLSPRAIVQNLMQPAFMTMPELGYSYGFRKLGKAYVQLLTGDYRKILSKAVTEGAIPAQWTTELRDAVRGGVKRGALYRVTEAVLDTWANIAMYLFEASEKVNRASHYLISKEIAQDVMRGDDGPKAFLARIPPTYRRDILTAAKRGDADTTEQLVRNYLIGKTLFNYNRITMSEFGRSMGPLFSMFSKWPTTVAGELLDVYQSRGVGKGSAEVARRYLFPIAIASGLGYLLFPEEMPRDSQKAMPAPKVSTGEQLFFGKPKSALIRGPATGTPLGSVEGIVSGRAFSPPIVTFVRDPVVALLTADPDKLGKWAADSARTLVPGAGILRFMEKDLPAITDTFFGTQYEPYKPRKDNN